MLTKDDKRWILETVHSANRSTVALLSAQIEKLARMTARGFSAGASKEELWAVENRLTSVEHHVGSLESRLEHLEDTVVTKDYFDERLGIVTH